MSSPLVTIIVPVFKAEKYIEGCVKTLFEQTFSDIEFIFVNDCTPDNSMVLLEEKIKEYPQRQSQVLIIDQDRNLGNAAARNLGLDKAQGEYIIQIDSDDWVELDMIECMYNKAKDTDADIICCGCVEESTNMQKIYNFPNVISQKEMIDKMPYSLLCSSVWNKLIKKSLYEENKIRCFDDTNNWVDIGLIIRLCFFSKKMEIIPQPFYHYNRINENSVSKKPSLKRIDDMIICAQHIKRFFQDQGVEKDYALTINYILYLAKDRLLYDKSVRDYKRWKYLFSETHKYIWQFPKLTIFKRFVFTLAACGVPFLPTLLLDMRTKVNI